MGEFSISIHLAYLVYRVTLGVLDFTSCTNLEAYWYFFQYFSKDDRKDSNQKYFGTHLWDLSSLEVICVVCHYTWKVLIAAYKNILRRGRGPVQHRKTFSIIRLVYRYLREVKQIKADLVLNTISIN